MARSTAQRGEEGERLAESFLRRRGLKTLARRFHAPTGELDLVMREGRTIVFVEVKTLVSRAAKDPQDQVTHAKRQKLALTAEWFLRQQRLDDAPCRFDVVSVILPDDGAAAIEHFPNAFTP